MLDRIKNAAKWIGITVAGLAEAAFTGGSTITTSAATPDEPAESDDSDDSDDGVKPSESETP